jgi:DNA repair and recombination protein RAD52
MSFTPDQIAALEAPLSAGNVKERTQAGRQFSYVEGWHAIAEANRIFGFGEWSRETTELRQLGEPREVGGKWRVGYLAKVRITVRAAGDVIVREGCGYGSGIDNDQGQAHESALKEAETDAMKRALMTFGNPFGLALYDKGKANVVAEPPPPTAADMAIHLLRSFDSSPEHFREAWEANKVGWQKVMSAPDFTRVFAVRQQIAKAFAEAAAVKRQASEAKPQPPAPKADAFDISDDEIPF